MQVKFEVPNDGRVGYEIQRCMAEILGESPRLTLADTQHFCMLMNWDATVKTGDGRDFTCDASGTIVEVRS